MPVTPPDKRTYTEVIRAPNSRRLKAALDQFLKDMESNPTIEYELVLIEPAVAVDYLQRPVPKKECEDPARNMAATRPDDCRVGHPIGIRNCNECAECEYAPCERCENAD